MHFVENRILYKMIKSSSGIFLKILKKSIVLAAEFRQLFELFFTSKDHSRRLKSTASCTDFYALSNEIPFKKIVSKMAEK